MEQQVGSGPKGQGTSVPVPRGGEGPGALPLLIVQVSHRPVHQLVGRPLQGHDVSCLVQGQVSRDGLHVVPLQREKDSGLLGGRVRVHGEHDRNPGVGSLPPSHGHLEHPKPPAKRPH